MKINVEALNDLKEYIESNHNTFEHYILLEYDVLNYLVNSVVDNSSDGLDSVISK